LARCVQHAAAMTLRTLARAILVATALGSAANASAQPLPTFQGRFGALISGPGRIAVSTSGRFFVVNARGAVNALTPRGDFLGTVFQGAWAVTAGPAEKVFVASNAAELVTIDGRTGRVLSRSGMGVSKGPIGLSYDATRDVIWMVFESGSVQARRADGTVAAQFSPELTGLLALSDVAYDSQTDVVWVAQGQPKSGGMIFGLKAVDGTKLKTIGADGTGPVKVTGALALGPAGSVYVTDLFAGTVAVVDAAGTAVGTISVPKAGSSLPQPAGIAFTSTGDLVVADLNATQINRFGDGSPLPVCAGDTDCDGMPDAWEVANGLNPIDPSDALLDLDGDGLLNAEEFALGTDPFKADTDGDGYSDALEIATGYDPLNPNDHRPVVVAGGVTEFAPGLVTLSASVARVGDAGTCRVFWKQTGGPTVNLKNAASFSPTFLARKAQTYSFSVVATCGGVSSASTAVAATVLNLAPIVDTVRVATAGVGEYVRLDARRSSDANGDAVGLVWEQVSGPEVLVKSASPAVSALLSGEGAYRFKVTAMDPAAAASAGEAIVVALGAKPVPAAAVVSPVFGEIGQRIALDASGSYRAADATFAWRQLAGPPVAVLDAEGPVAAVVPSEAGRYIFEVTVAQGGVAGPPALVEAFVAATGRTLPVAVAAAPVAAPVGSMVTLDGTASVSASGEPLEYAWRQVSGPAAGLGSPGSALASAYLFSAGSHEFELTVKDGAGVGSPIRIRVEARAAGQAVPVARVLAPATAAVGELVRLDGRGSIGATKYRWTQVGGPWVLLGGEAVESFRPKAAGTYVFELEMERGSVRSAPVRVSVVVSDGMEN
jgi:DNA-binding beta-propeller fold protein YncE